MECQWMGDFLNGILKYKYDPVSLLKKKKMNEYMILISVVKNGTDIFSYILVELAWVNEFDDN